MEDVNTCVQTMMDHLLVTATKVMLFRLTTRGVKVSSNDQSVCDLSDYLSACIYVFSILDDK